MFGGVLHVFFETVQAILATHARVTFYYSYDSLNVPLAVLDRSIRIFLSRTCEKSTSGLAKFTQTSGRACYAAAWHAMNALREDGNMHYLCTEHPEALFYGVSVIRNVHAYAAKVSPLVLVYNPSNWMLLWGLRDVASLRLHGAVLLYLIAPYFSDEQGSGEFMNVFNGEEAPEAPGPEAQQRESFARDRQYITKFLLRLLMRVSKSIASYPLMTEAALAELLSERYIRSKLGGSTSSVDGMQIVRSVNEWLIHVDPSHPKSIELIFPGHDPALCKSSPMVAGINKGRLPGWILALAAPSAPVLLCQRDIDYCSSGIRHAIYSLARPAGSAVKEIYLNDFRSRVEEDAYFAQPWSEMVGVPERPFQCPWLSGLTAKPELEAQAETFFMFLWDSGQPPVEVRAPRKLLCALREASGETGLPYVLLLSIALLFRGNYLPRWCADLLLAGWCCSTVENALEGAAEHSEEKAELRSRSLERWKLRSPPETPPVPLRRVLRLISINASVINHLLLANDILLGAILTPPLSLFEQRQRQTLMKTSANCSPAILYDMAVEPCVALHRWICNSVAAHLRGVESGLLDDGEKATERLLEEWYVRSQRERGAAVVWCDHPSMSTLLRAMETD
jgi:hypothetical protein